MLWICAGCTTGYSVGAPRCPHCASTLYRPQGAEDGPVLDSVAQGSPGAVVTAYDAMVRVEERGANA